MNDSACGEPWNRLKRQRLVIRIEFSAWLQEKSIPLEISYH